MLVIHIRLVTLSQSHMDLIFLIKCTTQVLLVTSDMVGGEEEEEEGEEEGEGGKDESFI